jgi:hypothetical protein
MSLTDTIATDFDKALPIIGVVDSLAASFAGNIYRKVAGTVENVQGWETSHPEVQLAVSLLTTMLSGYGIKIAPEINLGLHILGKLGTLMAADSTVPGPMPEPSLPPVIAKAA